MKEELSFSDYYKYCIACAVVYCIPVFFFFTNEKFQNTWLLYLGSVLFAFAVLISDVVVSKKTEKRFKAQYNVYNGAKNNFQKHYYSVCYCRFACIYFQK